MLIAGDIGGTKVDLAVYSVEGGPRAPIAEKTFSSADYPSLEAIVGQFLADVDQPVSKAVFGAAGPVVDDRIEVTNLPWVIDGAHLQEALGFSSVAPVSYTHLTLPTN